jgi:hypothetical protein
MEATYFSETSVMIYQITRRHIGEDNSFDILEFVKINLLYEQSYVLRSVRNFKEDNLKLSLVYEHSKYAENKIL